MNEENIPFSEIETLKSGIGKIFGGDAADDVCNLILLSDMAQISDFGKGEVIFEDGHTFPALGILLSGKAEVVRKSGDGASVLLKSIFAGDAFGAALLFGGEEGYVTSIHALCDTRVAFIPQALAKEALMRYSNAAIGYITFLSEKIRFLNSKIATFTAEGAEGKLADYILRTSKGEEKIILSVSFVKLAEILGLGRASLYRALDTLCEAGAIKKSGKVIEILNKNKLKQISG